MSSKRLLIAVAACMPLAACNTAQTHIGDDDPLFGESVKYDAAIQTINPAPVYSAESAQPGSNGAVGANAVKRYETDKVKQPPTTQSTMGSSGGGGGGSH